MKRLFIGILLLFAFCNSVNALPPTVDFTFVPNSPLINQAIIFDPTIISASDLNFLNWQFDSDGNTNYTYNPGLFVDKFVDTNNTDLNVHNTDWNAVSESPLMFWYAKIFNNQAWLRADTNGTNNFIKVTLQNNDNNISLNGQTFTAKFQLIDLNYITGAESQVQNTIVRPSDLNFLANLRFLNSSFGGDINAVAQYDGINLTNIVVNRGDYFEIRLTRKSSLIYDINFFRNGTNFASAGDQNINSDTMRFQFGMDTGGSGAKMTYMIDDFNVSGNATPINIDRNETHTFTTSGTKTVCLTAGNPDGNTTTCKQPIVSGFVQLSVRDEETGTPLNGVLLTLGDTNSTTGASGDANFITDSLSFPITLMAQKSGYATRQFEYLSLNGLTQDYNLSLRDGNDTTDIDFQFFAPDQTTKLTNRIIVAKKNGGVSGRILTDSSGFGNMILASQDSGYSFLIYEEGSDSNSGSEIEYTYGTITVTVNRPKNELTDLNISPNNFSLSVGGLGLQTYTGTLPISSIVIIGNTIDPYTISVVDSNADGQQYYARNYIAQGLGATSALTIQPYLIPIADGILVNLTAKDLSTNQTIPNIRIQMYTGIGGANVIVEDSLTDSAGVAQVVMIAQKAYNLLITSSNRDINYFSGYQTLYPSSQNFTIWINYFDNQITINEKNTNITIYPTSTAIINNLQRIDVNVDTNAPHDYIYVQAFDSNTLVDQNNCSASPCHVSLTMNFNNFDTNFLNIKVIIQNNDFNFTRTINYYTAPFLNSVVTRVQNLKNKIGPVTLGVIMFAVIFGLIAFLGSNGLGNNMSQIFLIVITAGVFYFLWFYDVTKLFGGELFVAFLAGLFGVMLIYFWARQKGGP